MARGPLFPRSRARSRPGGNQAPLFDSEYRPAFDVDDGNLGSAAAPVPNSVSPSDYWDIYDPTTTSNPERPRTLQARYNPDLRRIEVEFRDGTKYHYDNVHPTTWRGFKRTPSPGKYINRILNDHSRGYGGFGTPDG